MAAMFARVRRVGLAAFKKGRRSCAGRSAAAAPDRASARGLVEVPRGSIALERCTRSLEGGAMRTAAWTAAAIVAAVVSTGAAGQSAGSYPNRVIRFVVPVAAGGTVLVRLHAEV